MEKQSQQKSKTGRPKGSTDQFGEKRMVSFKMPINHIEKMERLAHRYGNKTAVIRAGLDALDDE